MEKRMRIIEIFSVFFYVEKNGNGERALIDISGHCPNKGCGGKLFATIAVGRISKDRYLAKNAVALWKDAEFELPTQIFCTNCGGHMEVPQDMSEDLSKIAAEFLRNLREERRSTKAELN